ncbi:MAG: hypothetical protein HY044_01960 [Candidatus Woesebacteria bacterium]|nr:MAG: hypothetical protein HY044_01960 [Candidatus Woesebacteria bacterium]
MSLTTIATNTRKTIRYTIYGIIFLIIGRFILGIVINIYTSAFPKPPPAPTLAFGKLPKISFPDQKDLPKFNFQLQTSNGALPTFSTQSKVYFMPKSNVSLLSFDDAKAKAQKLGFKGDPQKISETVLRFSDPTSPSTLEINIVSGVFSISYNLSADPQALSKLPPTPDSAVSQVKSFLSSNGLMFPDLEGGTSKVDFLNVADAKLVPVLSLSEAKIVKVNLFRQDYDKFPVVTMNPTEGNVWFLVTGAKNIIAGEYHYFPVDMTQVATYPIKTAQDAYKDLQSGAGYVASLGQNGDGNVVIRKVYLAYFDPGNSTDQFLQPITVFEGDRGFVSYVPMIKSDFYGD